jgi:esterase/lipase superfamily enzyme
VPANRDPAQKSYVPKGALKSPRWHFYMFRHQALAEREMVALAKEKTGSSQAPQVLLYVHGIRNALPDAAETLAQLVVDTGFTGKAMFMSWPAPITLLPNDENYRENKAFALAPKSVNLLGGVLEDFLLDGGADLHLLAHSAGADLSVNALQVVTPDIRRSPSLASIVLAAADSELPQFEVKVAPALSRQGRIVVNYCGESDRALRESRHTQRATRIRKDREVGDAR